MEQEVANEMIVFGDGDLRQVQKVASTGLLLLAPGASPLKAIEKLPSVNFHSADLFGT